MATWKSGLFEIKCPLCLFNSICSACSLAHIHEKLGNPSCSKQVACLLACFLDTGLCQAIWYGQKAKGDKGESLMTGILKGLFCGSCYVHQQYKEYDLDPSPGFIVGKCMSPAQAEMV
jgi:hypothetical protein